MPYNTGIPISVRAEAQRGQNTYQYRVSQRNRNYLQQQVETGQKHMSRVHKQGATRSQQQQQPPCIARIYIYTRADRSKLMLASTYSSRNRNHVPPGKVPEGKIRSPYFALSLQNESYSGVCLPWKTKQDDVITTAVQGSAIFWTSLWSQNHDTEILQYTVMQ